MLTFGKTNMVALEKRGERKIPEAPELNRSASHCPRGDLANGFWPSAENERTEPRPSTNEIFGRQRVGAFAAFRVRRSLNDRHFSRRKSRRVRNLRLGGVSRAKTGSPAPEAILAGYR